MILKASLQNGWKYANCRAHDREANPVRKCVEHLQRLAALTLWVLHGSGHITGLTENLMAVFKGRRIKNSATNGCLYFPDTHAIIVV
jgi:hypothetical protein